MRSDRKELLRQLREFFSCHHEDLVCLPIMRHLVEYRLDDLLAFTTAITTRLQA